MTFLYKRFYECEEEGGIETAISVIDCMLCATRGSDLAFDFVGVGQDTMEAEGDFLTISRKFIDVVNLGMARQKITDDQYDVLNSFHTLIAIVAEQNAMSIHKGAKKTGFFRFDSSKCGEMFENVLDFSMFEKQEEKQEFEEVKKVEKRTLVVPTSILSSRRREQAHKETKYVSFIDDDVLNGSSSFIVDSSWGEGKTMDDVLDGDGDESLGMDGAEQKKAFTWGTVRQSYVDEAGNDLMKLKDGAEDDRKNFSKGAFHAENARLSTLVSERDRLIIKQDATIARLHEDLNVVCDEKKETEEKVRVQGGEVMKLKGFLEKSMGEMNEMMKTFEEMRDMIRKRDALILHMKDEK